MLKTSRGSRQNIVGPGQAADALRRSDWRLGPKYSLLAVMLVCNTSACMYECGNKHAPVE